MRPSETDLAWLAGIVDGEGTIGISRTNAKEKPHPYLRPHFQVVNTDLRILDRARTIMTAVTGLPHNCVVSNKGGNGQKRGYRIASNTQMSLVLLLPLLMPYLTGKREQAELVLDFCKRKSSRLSYTWYEHKEDDERIYSTCLQLNRRGVPNDARVVQLVRSA